MEVLHLDKAGFDEKVRGAQGAAMVDFWAPWCGPCKMLGPIIEQFAEETEGVTIAKVNVDDEQELAMEFGVMSIPTVIFFKDGKEVTRKVGLVQKQALSEQLESIR